MGKKKQVSPDRSSITVFLLMILTNLYFFVSFYNRGLFFGNQPSFEQPIYTTVVCVSMLMLLGAFAYFSKSTLSYKQLVSMLLGWSVVLIYFITSFFAASAHTARDMTLVSFAWISFYILAILIHEKTKRTYLVVNGILFSGYLIVILGFLYWFGLLSYQDALLERRLSNVFQYPNTYAVLLIGMVFSQIYMLSTNIIRHRWLVSLHAAMTIPVMVSFFLTLSRGALVVLALLFILQLLFLKPAQQLLSIGYMVLISILSLIGVQLLYPLQDKSYEAVVGLIVIVGLSAVVAIGSYLFSKIKRLKVSEKPEGRFYHSVLLPILLLVIVTGCALLVLTRSPVLSVLPDTLEQRLLTIQFGDSSFEQRAVYYQDAWQMVKDHWLLGAGGAWGKLYQEYQSYPYIGTQAHSFYMQVLNEIGIIGLVLILLIIVWSYYHHIRHYRKIPPYRHIYFLLATPILLHSFIDFHMSYMYIATLVFFCLGAMIGTDDESTMFSGFSKVPRYAQGLTLAVVSFVILFTSISYANAAQDFRKAVTEGDYSSLLKAVAARKDHPHYVVTQSQALIQDYALNQNEASLKEAEQRLTSLREREPSNIDAILLQGQLYAVQGELDKAIALYEQALDRAPWVQRIHDQLMNLYYQMGRTDPVWWDKAMEHYTVLTASIERFQEEGVYRKRFFQLDQMKAIMEQIEEELS